MTASLAFETSSGDVLTLAHALYEQGDVPAAIAIAREVFAAVAHEDRALEWLSDWIGRLKQAEDDEPALTSLAPAVKVLAAHGNRGDAVRVLTTATALFPYKGSIVIREVIRDWHSGPRQDPPASESAAHINVVRQIIGWPLGSVVLGAAQRQGIVLAEPRRNYARLLRRVTSRTPLALEPESLRLLINSVDEMYKFGATEPAVRLAITGIAAAKPNRPLPGAELDDAEVKDARLLRLKGYPTEAANTVIDAMGPRVASDETFRHVRRMLTTVANEPLSWIVRGELENTSAGEKPARTPAGADTPQVVSERPTGNDPPPPPDDVSGASPRYLVARTNDPVKLDEIFVLTARIATEPLPDAEGQGSAPVRGDVAGELSISIYAKDFTAITATQQTINVPVTGNSDWVPFELRPRKEGVLPIEVMAWKNSAQVGAVTIFVGVGKAQRGDGVASAELDIRQPEKGEYTLEVAYLEDTRQYEFRLRSDEGGDEPPVKTSALVDQLLATYQDIIDGLNRRARNADGLSEYAETEWLGSVGTSLFKHFVPSALQQILWERRDKVKYLKILSKADGMPWELLYLSNPATGKDGQFIADVSTVFRWSYAPPACRSLTKTNAYFVLPSDSPAHADAEVTYVQQRLSRKGKNVIDDLDSLLRLLNAGSFSLLHFASHNVVDPTATGGLYVRFGKQRFELQFTEKWTANQFRAQTPLVFMNACSSGASTRLYTAMGSWAEKFVTSGCGAFVGALWEIRDASALTFAQSFYDALTGGKNLGESMRTAKNVLKPSDPTRLAYTLYGNPLARLS